MADLFMLYGFGVTASQDALRSAGLLARNLFVFLRSGAAENLLDGLGLSRVHRGRPVAPECGDRRILSVAISYGSVETLASFSIRKQIWYLPEVTCRRSLTTPIHERPTEWPYGAIDLS